MIWLLSNLEGTGLKTGHKKALEEVFGWTSLKEQSVNMLMFWGTTPPPNSGHALQKRLLISRWKWIASWASASHCSCSSAHLMYPQIQWPLGEVGWAGLSNTCSPHLCCRRVPCLPAAKTNTESEVISQALSGRWIILDLCHHRQSGNLSSLE